MESYRLKNIVILILALLNVCLLVSLGIREASEKSARDRATEQLVALFAADGMELDPDMIPSQSPPASRTLARDTEQDEALAAYFLGSGLARSDQGGGTHAYTNGAQAAVFRDNGGFEISAGYLPVEDLQDFLRRFCEEFDYRDLTTALENGTGTATAVQYVDDVPVFNATAVFTFENGALVTVTGTHLPQDSGQSIAASAEPLSATAALTAFLTVRREAGSVPSPITDISLCYEVQSSTTSPMTLTPSWRITTGSSVYYVNCSTGTVTHN